MELLAKILVLNHGLWKVYKINRIILVETDKQTITWELEYNKNILNEIYHSMSILGYTFKAVFYLGQ